MEAAWPHAEDEHKLRFLNAVSLADSPKLLSSLWQELRLPRVRRNAFRVRREICLLIADAGDAAWDTLGSVWSETCEVGLSGDLSAAGRIGHCGLSPRKSSTTTAGTHSPRRLRRSCTKPWSRMWASVSSYCSRTSGSTRLRMPCSVGAVTPPPRGPSTPHALNIPRQPGRGEGCLAARALHRPGGLGRARRSREGPRLACLAALLRPPLDRAADVRHSLPPLVGPLWAGTGRAERPSAGSERLPAWCRRLDTVGRRGPTAQARARRRAGDPLRKLGHALYETEAKAARRAQQITGP